MTDSSIPQREDRTTKSSPITSPRDERQPLLNQSGHSSHEALFGTAEESGVNKDDTAAGVITVRQIFTAKQFAVMMCFFMNGLCTTAVGVSRLASSASLGVADRV